MGGRLVQYAPPNELLERPANEFVARFVGADRGLKRLSLRLLSEIPLGAVVDGGPPLDEGTTLRDAVSAMLAVGASSVVVTRAEQPVGSISLERITLLLAGEQ